MHLLNAILKFLDVLMGYDDTPDHCPDCAKRPSRCESGCRYDWFG